MSEIKYGLISKVDSEVLEKTIDLICEQSKSGSIHVTEIGLYSGDTGNGIREYINSKGRTTYLTGIENFKDQQPLSKLNWYNQILQGNSNEVYFKLKDNSQDLIFVDGCHCFAHAISDFFCYAPKVKEGGYIAFHDTGKHIKPFKDFQHGDKNNPDAYISVRKALGAIGLFSTFLHYGFDEAGPPPVFKRWMLILDEADPSDEAGGICVFKKLY